MSAAAKIAVPVPSGWNAQTAAYGLSWYRVMATALSRPGHGMLSCPLAATLKDVHRITVTDTINHGSHPCQAPTRPAADFAASSGERAILNSAASTGRHACRKSTVVIREPRAASTSVSV